MSSYFGDQIEYNDQGISYAIQDIRALTTRSFLCNMSASTSTPGAASLAAIQSPSEPGEESLLTFTAMPEGSSAAVHAISFRDCSGLAITINLPQALPNVYSLVLAMDCHSATSSIQAMFLNLKASTIADGTLTDLYLDGVAGNDEGEVLRINCKTI